MSTLARASYDSDLIDEEWELVCPLLPEHPPRGNDPWIPKREIVNAIFYINKHGCTWLGLPPDFPKWQTVDSYFRQWREQGVWEAMNAALRNARARCGGKSFRTDRRDHRQSIGENDGKRGVHGYDAGKKINGRKRHILVDTMGLLLAVVVHSVAIQDRDGAKLVFLKAATSFPAITLVWADSDYAGTLIAWLATWCGWVLEIVRKLEGQVGFQVLPRRWVVERTFAWLGHSRRLSKDFEELVENSEAMVQIAMLRLMLQRLCRSVPPQKR